MQNALELTDGIHPELSFEDYVKIPRLNFSILKLMHDSAEQCRLGELGGLKDMESQALSFGHAYHSYVLTPELFDRDYYVAPKVHRKGKDWDEILTVASMKGIPEGIFFGKSLSWRFKR